MRRKCLNLSSNEKTSRKKHVLLAVVLIAMLLISMGIVFYINSELDAAQAANQQLGVNNQILNQTILQVNATIPIVTINVSFIPTPPEIDVIPNTVTFLSGYVEATNLANLYYPCTLAATFNVSYATTDLRAQILFSYVYFQQVALAKGIELVQLPFGIFPLSIYNATKGDTITLYATATVTVTWTPVGTVMSQEVTSTSFQVNVT